MHIIKRLYSVLNANHDLDMNDTQVQNIDKNQPACHSLQLVLNRHCENGNAAIQ